jgi:hypothetical protein
MLLPFAGVPSPLARRDTASECCRNPRSGRFDALNQGLRAGPPAKLRNDKITQVENKDLQIGSGGRFELYSKHLIQIQAIAASIDVPVDLRTNGSLKKVERDGPHYEH